MVSGGLAAWFGSLPLGKNGLRNCSDEEDKIYNAGLLADCKPGRRSQVDEGLAGFDAGFDDANSQQQPATGICRAAGDGREGRGEEPAGGGERDGYACPGFRADTIELGFYSSDEEIADGAG